MRPRDAGARALAAPRAPFGDGRKRFSRAGRSACAPEPVRGRRERRGTRRAGGVLMDANGLRFWLLADARHWRLGDGATYDVEHRCLRLDSRRDAALSPPEIEGAPPAVPVLAPA